MNLGNHLLKVAMLSSISIASLSAGSVAFAQDSAPQASDEADDNVIIVTATTVVIIFIIISTASRQFRNRWIY